MPDKPTKQLPIDGICALRMSPPKVWFAEVTEPLVNDFICDPTKLCRVVSAVREVFHFHERLYHYWRAIDPARINNIDKDEAFLDHLKKKSHSFTVLQIAANATKHHALREVKPLPQGVKLTIVPTQIFECSVVTATQIHATIGDGGPNTLAVIQDAMDIYRTYL